MKEFFLTMAVLPPRLAESTWLRRSWLMEMLYTLILLSKIGKNCKIQEDDFYLYIHTCTGPMLNWTHWRKRD